MCSGSHRCPVCEEYHICDAQAKHEEEGVVCMDGTESFCNNCQTKRDLDVVTNLYINDRVSTEFIQDYFRNIINVGY